MPRTSRTDNVRKICTCVRWKTCAHPWYLDYQRENVRYRDNLDKLVGYVSDTSRPERFHTPAVVEMQRRQSVAVREFNEQSGKQADTVIRLTRWIMGLTIALGVIAGIQSITMIWGA